MQHYKKLLLGMVATLSLLATATPVFASTGGTLAKHRDFNTGVSSSATVEKSTSQATQYTDSRATQAPQALVYGFNAINNDPNQVYFANEAGVKQTGWIKHDGGWSYADSTGKVLRNKWFHDTGNGKWYYFNMRCQMETNVNVGSYYLASDGSWQGDARANANNYTKVSVGYTYMDLNTVESLISSGKMKMNVAHGKTLGATKVGTGALTLYLAN